MHPADLERVVHRRLQQLPPPGAPSTLLPRVMALVQTWAVAAVVSAGVVHVADCAAARIGCGAGGGRGCRDVAGAALTLTARGAIGDLARPLHRERTRSRRAGAGGVERAGRVVARTVPARAAGRLRARPGNGNGVCGRRIRGQSRRLWKAGALMKLMTWTRVVIAALTIGGAVGVATGVASAQTPATNTPAQVIAVWGSASQVDSGVREPDDAAVARTTTEPIA